MSDASFEQMILDRLAKAGVQNGRRNERLEFDSVEPHGGTYIQSIATRKDAAESGRGRVAISVGPSFIKQVVRQANGLDGIDLLCVLAFAFDPQAIGATDEYIASSEGFDVAAERALGKVRVLLVRMSPTSPSIAPTRVRSS